ncbi:MAG: caspase family protein [Anaerolineae bacterium]|nr:caspase family protein [Gloeobacterales cyanobacterium ES-bin-313]
MNAYVPAATRALLVGIDRYEAGDRWNLNGPVPDVLRIAKWLTGIGVPPANLTVLLSPLESNVALVDEITQLLGTAPLPATEDQVKKAFEALQGQKADLLLVYWGGHGWLTQDGQRRLFVSDTTEKNLRNMDLNDQLTAMRTNLFSGTRKQVFVVDACANYAIGMAVTPPSTQVAKGTVLPGIEQFVLLAARPGDLAKNDDTQQTGVYTRELLKELNSLPPAENWSEQLPQISSRLQSRFDELRAQGRTRQTPVYLWHKDMVGNEYNFRLTPRALSSPIQQTARLPRTLSLAERGRLRDLFLACASMQSQAKRDAIVGDLSPNVASVISRGSDSNTDILNILKTVRDFRGGLAQLILAIHLYEGDSLPYQNLYAEINRILPEEVGEPQNQISGSITNSLP